MCWAVPAVVTKVEGSTAWVDLGDGVPRPVVVGIDGERIKPGDLVMAHAGVIISVLDINAIEEMKRNFVELFAELAPEGEKEKAAKEAEAMFQELLERSRKYAEAKEHNQIAVW
ncbi:MAG: HypC/HybG/HupF family hydrogenase formation chaperone [Thermoproteus sp.]